MVKHDQRHPSSLLRAFEAVIQEQCTPEQGSQAASPPVAPGPCQP